MEITLEKIDQVVDRTGCTYERAKQALEVCEGDVVESIIFIERNQKSVLDDLNGKISKKGSEMMDSLKEILKKGNATKIIVEKNGEIILNMPVTVGALGVVLGPMAAIIGVPAAMLSDFKIKILKNDGEVIDLNEYTEKKMTDIKDIFSKKTNQQDEKKDQDIDK